MNIEYLAADLASENPTSALSELRKWVVNATIPSIRSALAGVETPRSRQRLACAIGDILSNYPRTIYCYPAVMFVRAEAPMIPPPPSANIDGMELSWMSLRRLLGGNYANTSDNIRTNTPQAGAMVHWCKSENCENPPDVNIGELFPPMPGVEVIAAASAEGIPLAAGIEQMQLMYVYANNSAAESIQTYFCGDVEHGAARVKARLLREAVAKKQVCGPACEGK